MNKQLQKSTAAALCLALAFAAWTALVCLVDVQAIGPRGSTVGLATLNGAFHRLSGIHMTLYHVTDWLGLVPIGTALAFAVLGLVQWIGRKRLLSVDRSLFALGAFYLLVIGAYALFEYVVINRRPVLIEGYLEASYPSSTTLLVACVMPTAWMQLRDRVAHTHLRCLVSVLLWGFTLFTVIGRLVSGVHWLSDIVGGLLLSGALVAFYVRTAYGADQEKEEKHPCRAKKEKIMRYLIVVDMQVDFITGALGTAEACAIVPRVVDKVRSFDGRVIFTKDTHGDDYMETREGVRLPVPHCIKGTEGHELCEELRSLADEIVEKPTFGSVELVHLLQADGEVEYIELCGLCTDICVISNAMLLKAAFPEVDIAVDAACSAGVTPASHRNALAAMRAVQIDILNGD